MIGLNDSPKTLFGTAIAAIGIRMVFFDQLLVASLDLILLGICTKAKCIEGFSLKGFQLAVGLHTLPAGLALAKTIGKTEGIADSRVGRAGRSGS